MVKDGSTEKPIQTADFRYNESEKEVELEPGVRRGEGDEELAEYLNQDRDKIYSKNELTESGKQFFEY